MDARQHILVVDDDPKIRLLLRRCFEGEGYRVTEVGCGRDIAAAMAQDRPDLITLDLSLPDGDGLSLAKQIRATSTVPIVMVTGKGETIDRVVGLELGADDYIAKPFHVREVLARVRAVLRRADARAGDVAPAAVAVAAVAGQERFGFAGFSLDVGKRELRNGEGRLAPLTTAEFSLLEVLVRHPNRVLSRDQIMDLLKGHAWSPYDRSIDNLVAKVRRKIEADADQPLLIKTVRGVGYSFTADVTQV